MGSRALDVFPPPTIEGWEPARYLAPLLAPVAEEHMEAELSIHFSIK